LGLKPEVLPFGNNEEEDTMNRDMILDDCRDKLAGLVHEQSTNLPAYEPLNISPWIAMSLMQKAIRRGREDWALRASATLLKIAPDRFWRRLCITAYEDIGVADMESISLVTSSLKGKRWREKVGGEWSVASYLITRMSQEANCRAADDLVAVAIYHPSLETARQDLILKPTYDLLEYATGPARLPERAVALWYAIGSNSFNSHGFPIRQGEPQVAFDHLRTVGIPDTVIEIAREGFRKSGEILCPFIILLWREYQQSPSETEPDEIPEEELIGGVPCWAFDMHVREGNQAMNQFLKMDCDSADWIKAHLPSNKRRWFLGEVLFRIESGVVANRLRWEAGDDLRQKADWECFGLEPPAVSELTELLRSDLPKLNEVRRDVFVSNLR
jgi:hypothetical protein